MGTLGCLDLEGVCFRVWGTIDTIDDNRDVLGMRDDE